MDNKQFDIEELANEMFPDYYNNDYYLLEDDRKYIVIKTYEKLKELGLIKE